MNWLGNTEQGQTTLLNMSPFSCIMRHIAATLANLDLEWVRKASVKQTCACHMNSELSKSAKASDQRNHLAEFFVQDPPLLAVLDQAVVVEL